MSMTVRQPGLLRRIGKSLGVIAGIYILVLAAYVGITLVPGNAQAVTMIMPTDGLWASLPSNVSVISWGGYTAQLASNDNTPANKIGQPPCTTR